MSFKYHNFENVKRVLFKQKNINFKCYYHNDYLIFYQTSSRGTNNDEFKINHCYFYEFYKQEFM